MSWRLTVDGDRAFVGLRIGLSPLRRRIYRQVTRPRSVHPTLAAAMVRIAGPSNGVRFLDPYCGVGTIPIEAAAVGEGLTIVGSDQDWCAVEAAIANGARLRWGG
jgi:tRNA (guanine6-N2)-methyltransferase